VKKLIFLSIVLTSIILIISCIKSSAETSTTGELTIKKEIHCGGEPKVLLIQNDGIVTFKEYGKIDQIKITAEEIESLKQCILDNKFFSLKKGYSDRNCSDCAGFTITITIGDKTHTVSCYGMAPKELEGILEKIESICPHEFHCQGWS